MSTLNELGDYLQDEGLGTQGSDLFLFSRPDEPDELTCLYQYAGGAPDYVQDSLNPSTENVMVQVVTRAKRPEVAEARCYAVWLALAPVRNQIIGSTHYLSITPTSGPALMNRDSNERSLFYFNASVEKEVSVAVS